jgi:hypothetical protein
MYRLNLFKGGKRGVFVFFLAVLCVFFYSPELFALKIVQLDQAKVRLFIPSGASKSGRIEVKNDDAQPKQLKAYLEDWFYEDTEGSKNFALAGTTPRSCAPWISFAPVEFTVPPFGKEYVNYIVRVPQDVKGGYYAVLFFESALGEKEEISQESTEGSSVSVPISVRVGSLFYVEVKDTVKRQIQIKRFSVQRQAQRDPLSIIIDVENIGNVDVTAGGIYNIINKKGEVYARGQFKDVYTLPQDKANLTAKWKDEIPQGQYDLIITLDLGKALEEMGVGRGPIMAREAQIEIGGNGEVLKVGDLK